MQLNLLIQRNQILITSINSTLSQVENLSKSLYLIKGVLASMFSYKSNSTVLTMSTHYTGANQPHWGVSQVVVQISTQGSQPPVDKTCAQIREKQLSKATTLLHSNNNRNNHIVRKETTKLKTILTFCVGQQQTKRLSKPELLMSQHCFLWTPRVRAGYLRGSLVVSPVIFLMVSASF